MPKRRRYATREELAQIMTQARGHGHELTIEHTRAALEVLGELGVPVASLLKIEVDEPMPDAG